jgi:outer membrane protein OmpA-like peptidoglycan-associated protein
LKILKDLEKMKKNILLLLILLLSGEIFAQAKSNRYNTSGGLLGNFNFTKFHITGDNAGNINYKTTTGFSGGLWLNFPFGKVVSFEPQLTYSLYKYEPAVANPTIFSGKMNYISVPLLLKFNLGSLFAISAGPQFDFLSSVKDNNNISTKNDFKKPNTSISGGIELFPHAVITVFGRYIHGLNNLDDSGNASSAIKLYNRNIQAGLKFKLFGKHTTPLKTIPATPDTATSTTSIDTDADGISDADDKCPQQAGTGKYGGCPVPDTDNDGIDDETDKCPDKKGLAKYTGCPVPDTDADGINDEEDKCPDQFGMARYGGCPVPDTDVDGINDEEDKCPKLFGPASNKGCPVFEMNGNKLVFKKGSAVLPTAGKSELDKVVNYLKANEGFDVMIEGHTDNSGSDKINIPLSKQRAETVKKYLVKNGIPSNRLFSTGLGSAMPLQENETAEGRNRNRRIEIKLKE